MKNIFIVLTLLPIALWAKTYTGCSDTAENAKIELSTKINSQVNVELNHRDTSTREDGEESVQSVIESYSRVSSHLNLVDISISKKNGEVCASIEKQDQVKHSQKLLSKILVYKEENLPEDLEQRLEMLGLWLETLDQVEHLTPLFLEDITDVQKITMSKNIKVFHDIYARTLSQMDALVWKSCEKDKQTALVSLNKKLFHKAQEEEGFFSRISNFFSSSKEDPLVHLLEPQITYTSSKTKVCAVIEKKSLLALSTKMFSDAKRYTQAKFPKDPKEKYTKVENYIEHLMVTQSLISLFEQSFSSADENMIENAITNFKEVLKTTYPQSVIFYIQGEHPVKIQLDGKYILKNEKINLPVGEHSYSVIRKDRCPISGSFSLDFREDKSISEDFEDRYFPTIIFLSEESVTAIVDGSAVPLNKAVEIKKCEGEVQYLAKLGNQSKTETLSLSPQKKYTVELNFLNSKEVLVFNATKTQYFTTRQDEKFSDTLSSLLSKNLRYESETSPKHGSLELKESGHFVYTPEEGYFGKDGFVYSIQTDTQESSNRVVIITIKKDTTVVIAPVLAPKETNTTEPKKEEVVEAKQEEKKETEEKESEEEKEEKKYQRFKEYVDSQEQNIEKLEKLQEKYPEMFKRLLKEKITP